jgi:NAD(P)H dehydrogenase (quinone)
MDLVPFIYGSAVQSGVLMSCAGDGKIGFVLRDDMAQALAIVLSGGAPLKPAYAMTPSRPAYGLAEIAAELGRANNKTIQYQSVSADEFRSTLAQFGTPPPAIEMAVGLAEAVKAGEFDASSSDLETLLGRAPIDLRTMLSRGK